MDSYPIIPVILALGAFVTGSVFWLVARRRHQGTDLDTIAFMLVGLAWMIIELVFQQTNVGSFGSVLVLTGMGIAFYRRLAQV